MTQTSTQTQDKGIVQRAVGRFLDDGTVAATKITCGFKPRIVKIINTTSKDMMEWFEGMADASAVKTVAAGTRTIITSNGITVAEDGFTIGLDTDVLVTSEQISWVAIG